MAVSRILGRVLLVYGRSLRINSSDYQIRNSSADMSELSNADKSGEGTYRRLVTWKYHRRTGGGYVLIHHVDSKGAWSRLGISVANVLVESCWSEAVHSRQFTPRQIPRMRLKVETAGTARQDFLWLHGKACVQATFSRCGPPRDALSPTQTRPRTLVLGVGLGRHAKLDHNKKSERQFLPSICESHPILMVHNNHPILCPRQFGTSTLVATAF